MKKGHPLLVWSRASGLVALTVALAGCGVLGAPTTPASITISGATLTTLAVTWTTSSGATNYQLFRDTASGGPFDTQVYDGADTTVTDTGLAGATTYYYKVRAGNGAGFSALSEATSGATASPSSTHTYADASADLAAYAQALSAAAMSTNPSDPAYNVTVGDTVTYYFANFVYGGITVNGTLTEDSTTDEIDGTTTFAGGSLSSIVFNHVTSSSGTEEITFNDSTVWIYDFATSTFTQI